MAVWLGIFFGFCHRPPILRHLRPILLLISVSIVWPPICMSSRSNRQDGEVIELSVCIRGLDITVRGPSVRATEALSLITGALAGLPAPGSVSDHSFELVSGAESVSAEPHRGLETRDEISATFGVCPGHWISQATRLGGSVESGRSRVRRAWLAGQWARAVLDERTRSPNRSEPLDLRARFYAVVRCDSIECPVVFRSSASYWSAVGSFSGRGANSVSHSFPSELEARAYLTAAGFEEPFLFRD